MADRLSRFANEPASARATASDRQGMERAAGTSAERAPRIVPSRTSDPPLRSPRDPADRHDRGSGQPAAREPSRPPRAEKEKVSTQEQGSRAAPASTPDAEAKPDLVPEERRSRRNKATDSQPPPASESAPWVTNRRSTEARAAPRHAEDPDSGDKPRSAPRAIKPALEARLERRPSTTESGRQRVATDEAGASPTTAAEDAPTKQADTDRPEKERSDKERGSKSHKADKHKSKHTSKERSTKSADK